jgi:hypothetical protein
MIQAKYRLSGIDNRIVTASSRIGRVHMFLHQFVRLALVDRPPGVTASEPLRPDECRAQIDEQQGSDQRGKIDHVRLLQIREQPSVKARQAAILTRPSINRAGNQMARFITVIPYLGSRFLALPHRLMGKSWRSASIWVGSLYKIDSE